MARGAALITAQGTAVQGWPDSCVRLVSLLLSHGAPRPSACCRGISAYLLPDMRTLTWSQSVTRNRAVPVSPCLARADGTLAVCLHCCWVKLMTGWPQARRVAARSPLLASSAATVCAPLLTSSSQTQPQSTPAQIMHTEPKSSAWLRRFPWCPRQKPLSNFPIELMC